jgi:deazaflavin-dependent oxidoreductase (nitroreductase family)
VTNRVTLPIAGLVPGLGVVQHVGRRSGRSYRTPVNVFRTPNGYVVALTYGADSDWLKNVLAAGGCSLRTRGATVELTDPRVVHEEGRGPVPRPVQVVLRLIGVTDYLELSRPEA